MWLLTCDGELFGGKPRWLRPGSAHLLGRTSGRSEEGERIQYIEHKSVSRKHLMIRVGEVKPGDSSKLTTRSVIQVTDASKVGTSLDGEQFKGETKTLTGKSHEIKLGAYEHAFHLTWQPVVLSFTSLPKKSKDPLASQREQLEQTDVKLIQEYLTNESTHVICKKRNTAAALQALCQARWLVTEAFVEQLIVATTQRKPNGLEENPISPLEEDLNLNWPKELDFPVPSTSERQPRPDSYLEPNEDRKEVFKDYTFVFLSQTQYDNLLPVITAGGGKALLRDVDPAENTVEDVVKYVKEIAGEKDADQFRLSQQRGEGGIVVVRMNEKDDSWTEFLSNIDLALDQRAVEQNEFLDAILTVNASGLRRQLEHGADEMPVNANDTAQKSLSENQSRPQTQRPITISASPPPEQAPRQAQQPQEEEPAAEQQTTEQPSEEPSVATMRRNRRIITQSRFKGFDDFDPSQFSRPASGSPEPPASVSQASNSRNMDINEPSQAAASHQNNRKRPAPTTEAEREEDMYASILTSHAAIKRQKTLAAQNGENDAGSTSLAGTDIAGTAGKSTKGKKKAKEMDVMAEVQALRKQQEEKRRQDEESLRNIDGIDLSGIKAQVEEMELPVRDPPPSRNVADGNAANDRWDPAWNGRKNFKKFRRQGERQEGPRLQRVMVALEEVPKKGHGLGDEYWLNSNSTGGNRSHKSKSQSQSQNTRHSSSQRAGEEIEDDDEDNARFRRRLQKSREDAEEEEASWVVFPEEIAGRPRDEGLRAAVDAAARSPSPATDSQRKGTGKRAATQQGGGPVKKARQTRLAPPVREVVNLDDDDDDELKFRRRRR